MCKRKREREAGRQAGRRGIFRHLQFVADAMLKVGERNKDGKIAFWLPAVLTPCSGWQRVVGGWGYIIVNV